jgi:hypothetical protein
MVMKKRIAEFVEMNCEFLIHSHSDVNSLGDPAEAQSVNP